MAAVASRSSSDRVFRALSDPTRREILALLRSGRQSVGDLATNFDISRPAVSKHLRLLRQAGLVKDKPQGAARMCELNAEPLKTIDVWLADYKRFWDRSLIRLKAHVEKQQ